jgi:hypothetical protein
MASGRTPTRLRKIAYREIYDSGPVVEVMMKAFLLACVAAILIATAAVVVLNQVQEPVQQAFATSAVRL